MNSTARAPELTYAEPTIPDITAADEDRLVRLPTASELYGRWERQQWSVADVRVGRDAEAWRALRPFQRQELMNALAELEVGEVCVTETLSSLVDHAPTTDDRIYLCTQLADEGRHVRFFQRYLIEAAGLDLEAAGEQEALAESTDYNDAFAPALRASTGRVRTDGGDPVAWYEALVYYHLITEGVLAATALRTTRILARRLPLAALDAGLTNVIRDESRHVSYGLTAARTGVADGYREAILAAYRRGIDLAAQVLIGPQRHSPAPKLRPALVYRAGQFQTQIDIARDRVGRQLRLIGLVADAADGQRRWDAACARALDAYRERWHEAHPIRAAAARPESA